MTVDEAGPGPVLLVEGRSSSGQNSGADLSVGGGKAVLTVADGSGQVVADMALEEVSLRLAHLCGLGPRRVRRTWSVGREALADLDTDPQTLIARVAERAPSDLDLGADGNEGSVWTLFAPDPGVGLMLLNTPSMLGHIFRAGDDLQFVADPLLCWIELNLLVRRLSLAAAERDQ